jgi:hypothetical protein
MITAGRHRPLAQNAWDESAVRAAIDEIAADAVAHFHEGASQSWCSPADERSAREALARHPVTSVA